MMSFRIMRCLLVCRVGKAKRAHRLDRPITRGHGAFRAFAHPTRYPNSAARLRLAIIEIRSR